MGNKFRMLSQAANFMMRATLTPVENVLLASVSRDESSFSHPVFVIGPPRSGTTLLYQILVNRFNFVYLNNLASKFYAAPTIGIWLTRGISALCLPKSLGYESHYGKTGSIFGPSEAGAFWYRWFPKGTYVYVPPKATETKKILELQRQVLGISKRFGAPMIFKNTYNSMRIAPIMESFPNAVFLVIQRDPLDTAQSILEGRVKGNGNKNDWWSVPPKEVDEIKKRPYWEQVVEQVYYIYKQIEEDSQRYGEGHFMYVSYRKLCEDPRGTVENIQMFLQKRGVHVLTKDDVPESFPYSCGKRIDDIEYTRLQRKVNKLWKG